MSFQVQSLCYHQIPYRFSVNQADTEPLKSSWTGAVPDLNQFGSMVNNKPKKGSRRPPNKWTKVSLNNPW